MYFKAYIMHARITIIHILNRGSCHLSLIIIFQVLTLSTHTHKKKVFKKWKKTTTKKQKANVSLGLFISIQFK